MTLDEGKYMIVNVQILPLLRTLLDGSDSRLGGRL
jgi:hypothetical protein